MGEFVAASGVIGIDIDVVRETVEKILNSPDAAELLEDEALEMGDLVLAAAPRGVTVMYPATFGAGADVSRRLSSLLGAPVFAFHIHDGDLWMYELFANGRLVDQFNPWPRYWTRKMTKDEVGKWAGDADAVCAHLPGLGRHEIEAYLVAWEDDSGRLVRSGKARTDDRFGYGNGWQLLDFLSRIGLTLPDPRPEPEPDRAEVEARDRYTQEAQLRRLRSLAERAWQEKDYRQVEEIYSSLGDVLSQVERRKLDYSRKKLAASSPPSPRADPPRVEVTRRPWWKLW